MDKHWKVMNADSSATYNLKTDLKIHEKLCQLLTLRGVKSFEQAKAFFRPQLNQLHDPFLMKGMDKAVTRILKAIEKGEKIMIYGDYDVDGTTAVAVVYSFLKNNFPGIKLLFHIPHRYREGYGISTHGIDEASYQGCSLIIALDCGIKSIEKTVYAREKGIDIIICDHHLPGSVLPDALAILNPKQQDCQYPYKELSGCGIGYKFICAIARKKNFSAASTNCYLDLVATSIAADIVPIDGENRILAFYGLKQANENPCLALKTIGETATISRPFNISDLVFIVAPRINAAGRMDDARKAVAFFIEEDPVKARELASQLHSDNFNRKEVDKLITEEALQLIKEREKQSSFKSTVLYQPHWHKGVVGIVASRLIEYYHRPTIVLTESGGKITGSARSVPGFNIYEAIHECSHLLENYGGHFFAAGMTLRPEKLMTFQDEFEKVVSQNILPESLIPTIEIDAEINLDDINSLFLKILKQFEPFGPSNLKPVFLSRNVRDWKNYSKIVKEKHIRFVIAQNNGYPFTGIGFGLAPKFDIISNGAPFDVVYTLDENEWEGTSTLQLKIIDIRATATS